MPTTKQTLFEKLSRERAEIQAESDIPTRQRRFAQFQARLENQIDSVIAAAERGKRAMSTEEYETFTASRAILDQMGSTPLFEPRRPQIEGSTTMLTNPASGWIDANGHAVHMLSPSQKITSVGSYHSEPLSVGKMLVGVITGNWRNADAEKQLAMSGANNVYGGYLVPPAAMGQLIDYARAKSALINAGAQTIPWSGSDVLTMARVKADPGFEVKAENEAFTESSLTFEQVTFTAHKVGVVITMSRELADDAANAASIVEQTLARALACEMDRLGLVGVQPNGLLYYTGLPTTGSIGAVAWEDVHAAKVAVEAANFTPSGYICSPTIGGDLDIITGGDGVNASKVWLGPPPSLTNVPRHITSNCPDADLFVGQWDQFVFAMRQDATMEISKEAGDYFKKHQLGIKLVVRFDVGCLNVNAFYGLTGITT